MTHLAVKQSIPDTNHAIEIAPRIWWVGHQIPGDIFQCHAYLIENGDQSLLFDPGSALTFRQTLRKIEEVVPFSKIRYFVCHHQDPDITGALPLIDSMISRDDAVLVTHWRAAALLKHLDLKLPMWQIDSKDWTLDIGGRRLRFLFTPYLHFPGAFCTFDEESGILFSSDLFGGFTEEFSLFARDESYFESIRPFHEHYMPSRDILLHGLLTIEKEPIRMIAPQHGSIIPEHLVTFMIEKLKGLECGLYLMAKNDSNIERLMELNRIVRDSMKAMILYREFGDVARHLSSLAQGILPIDTLEFYFQRGDEELLHFTPQNHYHGETVPHAAFFPSIFGDGEKGELSYTMMTLSQPEGTCRALAIPLDSTDDNEWRAAALFLLSEEVEISDEINEILGQLRMPLSVAVEREAIYRTLESDRDKIYEQSIRDTLTGLYTRLYMKDAVERLLGIHDRDATSGVALVMIDVDHFKAVNDTYGHATGDEVLKKVAGTMLENARSVDIPVRYGGEEFCLFIPVESVANGTIAAERVREAVGRLRFTKEEQSFSVTISAGVALHRKGETLLELIKRADRAIYDAKESGRNRVCMAK